MPKQFITTERSFLNGVLVPEGFVVSVDESQLAGNETNLADAGGIDKVAVIEASAIAPTGPNPTAPQQISHDTVQVAGGYAKPGAEVVGERTVAQDQRLVGLLDIDDTTEADTTQALADAQRENAELRLQLQREQVERDQPSTPTATRTTSASENDDDALVAGTVAAITAELGGKTDEELQAIRAAEVDRERPRSGVLKAVDAELASRQS